MKSGYKKIITTFAGRQDRMGFLANYTKKALDQNIVDEWHIWDFARNDKDKAWLKTLPSLSNKIKLFASVDYGQPDMSLASWEPYYSHYTLDKYLEETIIIRMDDDIVYFDVDKLKDFIEFRINNTEPFIISANVINNGVCAGIQTQRGVLEKNIYPPEGLLYESCCGVLWSNGRLAESVHEYFIKNIESFKQMTGVHKQPAGERISINCISYLGKDFKYTKSITRDEEHVISVVLSGQLQRNNLVYLPFIASHLSFYKQEETGFDSHKILNLYKTLL